MIDIHDPIVQESLLGRPACDQLSPVERHQYANRRVLVTGAGGSVGSELVRTLADCGPESITLIEQSEYNLFRIEREVAARWPHVRSIPVLGDVTRPRVMRAACEAAPPHVVFHAAAYQHVAILERDVCAAVRTNVLGTVTALESVGASDARFVLISSDKAVNPRSVMGATRRLAELVTLARHGTDLRPVVVRLGNVLGRRGSVLELMADCLQRGQPIPITHEEATRYFMTVGEAAALALRADLMRTGGAICWLDMGKPIRIVDLARRLLALADRKGERPVPLSYTGLRPGDKLNEEPMLGALDLGRTDHARVGIAQHAPVDVGALRRLVRALRADVSQADGLSTLADLCAAVPEYHPSEDARKAVGLVGLNAATGCHDDVDRLVA
jgi:FlaA1/EpsC-like NDP-sugar epimerase